MISSAGNFYSNPQEQSQNHHSNHLQHQQIQSGIISYQEQYLSPREMKYTLNQSHSIGQSSYLNPSAGSQNYINQNGNNNGGSSTSNSMSALQQQAQQQYMGNSTFAGQSHTQHIHSQSILSIKTQANKEQQYVYCPTHTNFFITNICAQKECIEPLCPECIVGHNELHVSNKTQSQLQNIQSARESAMISTEGIIKSLSQAKQELIPQLQITMNDSFKKNIETLNRLKQQILQVLEGFFRELQNKLNETFKNTKDLTEQLNAVIFQRVDNHQNILNELQSPLYIKALIESMENPTSFAIEEQSYSYLIDQIKDNNSIVFSKSQTIEESLKDMLPKLYSYQKRKKIFKFPSQSQGLFESRRMSDSRCNNSTDKQLKGLSSPLTQRSNIFSNQQVYNLQQLMGKEANSPTYKQTTMHNSRQSIVLSPRQREQICSAIKQNQILQSLKNVKNEYYNQSVQKRDAASFSSNPYSRTKTSSLGNENYFSSAVRTQQSQQKQRTTQSSMRTNTLNSNFETFNDFNDKSNDLDEIGRVFNNKVLNKNDLEKKDMKNDTLFKYNHNPNQRQDRPQSSILKTQQSDKNDKLDLPFNKQKIQEELIDTTKNDFMESFTVEEINGVKEEYFMNCDIVHCQEDDSPSQKCIYVFVEGTKIFHTLYFEEYLNFPKSAFKTDFLQIDFRIPICHSSISVPNMDLVLITGGIMYEKNKRKSIRDVYRLNIQKNSLEQVSGMIYPRSMHGTVYNEGRIYAIGGCSGYDESSSINKCEYYDLATQKWVEIADCLYKASGSGLTVFNKRYIFKIGGKDDIVKPVNFIECYDIKKNKWEQVQINLSFDGNNSMPFYPFVKQINKSQIILFGGQQHSTRSDASYIITVNHDEYSKFPPDMTFEKTRSLPSSFDFYQSQSYVYQNELYILKNATKISSDDKNIFLVYNGDNWSQA